MKNTTTLYQNLSDTKYPLLNSIVLLVITTKNIKGIFKENKGKVVYILEIIWLLGVMCRKYCGFNSNIT